MYLIADPANGISQKSSHFSIWNLTENMMQLYKDDA